MTSTASQPIIDTDLVLLDVDAGGDKEAVIGRLVSRLADAGRIHRRRRPDRRGHGPRGAVGHRPARRHRDPALPIAVRRHRHRSASPGCNPAVDFGAPDGPADLAFLIAAPDAGGAEHMKLLSSLARALVRKDFVESLRNATIGRARWSSWSTGCVNPAPAEPQAAAPAETPRRRADTPQDADRSRSPHARPASRTPTWPPTRLVAAAKEAGVDAARRDAGFVGQHAAVGRRRSPSADAVIFATDVGVKDKRRFAGKPVVASGVKRAINEPDKMVAEAACRRGQSRTPPRVRGRRGRRGRRSSAPAGGVGWGTRTRQILLTGVSYMIPFVAAGGLLIALGFLFAGYDIANKP